MADPIGFIVAIRNQASRQFEDLSSTVLHPDLDGARWERDLQAGETAVTGRGEEFVVCAVTPVEEDER